MKVFVFGNPDLKMDSVPLKIITELKNHFKDFDFITVDPNEEWEVPENLYIIDTVVGIKSPMIFNSLLTFKRAPNVTMHDFDAYANLRWLQKIGKLKDIKIYGLPPNILETEAMNFLKKYLK
ncbi:MAG: hypothetical protein WC725_03645 [Patescibacteria group bacterium]|jgi:hypothetical protein